METHTEWAVRYVKGAIDVYGYDEAGRTFYAFQGEPESAVRNLARNGKPVDGYKHQVVRREVTDWEES